MTLRHRHTLRSDRPLGPPTRTPSPDAGIYTCRLCRYIGETRSQSLPAKCPRCHAPQLDWLLK